MSIDIGFDPMHNFFLLREFLGQIRGIARKNLTLHIIHFALEFLNRTCYILCPLQGILLGLNNGRHLLHFVLQCANLVRVDVVLRQEDHSTHGRVHVFAQFHIKLLHFPVHDLLILFDLIFQTGNFVHLLFKLLSRITLFLKVQQAFIHFCQLFLKLRLGFAQQLKVDRVFHPNNNNNLTSRLSRSRFWDLNFS